MPLRWAGADDPAWGGKKGGGEKGNERGDSNENLMQALLLRKFGCGGELLQKCARAARGEKGIHPQEKVNNMQVARDQKLSHY